MVRQIVLDTETTGMDPANGHRVIEIGAIELINRKITGNSLHFYINPERGVEAEALAVHGLSNEFLQDKPLFKQIVHEFLTFVKGAELIIHNAPFDVNFLNYELKWVDSAFGLLTDHCRIFDTLVLARKMYPGQRNSLDALCKRLSVDNSHREWHGALLDAELLAKVYLNMTGGQTALFMEAESFDQQTNQAVAQQLGMKRINAVKSTVLTASEEENAEHQKFLELLQKKAGKHNWES